MGKKIHILNFVFRITLILSTLLSSAAPAAAEIQKPAGTAAGNPYDYVSSGNVNNPDGSGTEVTAATLTENPYTDDTTLCGTDVNNGEFSISYESTHTDDLYIYKLTKTTTNLKTNEITTENKNFDVHFDKTYKMINVYPSEDGMIGKRLMSEIRPDGGHYYENPTNGEQLFTIDSVYWDTFMANPEAYMKNTDGSWKYDGIYFGAIDANNNYKDLSDASMPLLLDFVNEGYAVVEGHDIPYANTENSYKFFTRFFGYDGLRHNNDPRSTNIAVADNSGTGAPGSSSDGNKLTNYPYKFPIGTQLKIANSHMLMYPSIDKTDLWITFIDLVLPSVHQTDPTYYSDERYINNGYLFTSKEYPNVAVSQAGHTTPNDIDLKLIVNMLMYILPKRKVSNTATFEVKDIAAPEIPSLLNVKRTGKTSLIFDVVADDFATKFDFSLQSAGIYHDISNSAATMNDVAIKSGTTWYLYSLDNNESGTVSYSTNCLGLPVASGNTTLVAGSAEDTLSVTIPSDARYLHIAAVDKAGNVGEVTTIEIPRTEDLSIQKEWDDLEDRFGLRSTEIVFDAFPNNSETVYGSCTATADSDYACTINDLLSYDENGNEITYTVRERNMPSAYSSDGASVNLASETSTTIINELVKKDLEINKVWEGDLDDLYSTRPVQITFDVYYGETVYGSCSARVEDGWKCSVTDLAVYDKSGEPIVYTVKERNVPRAYTADEPTVTEAEQTTVSLTNTLITKDLVVTKVWDDMENAYGSRATSLKFDLYQNDEKKDSCTVSSDTSWKCVFSGLPVYDPIGLEQKYVIKESEVPIGYSTEDVTVSGKDTIAAEVTNKLETKDITVIKNWTDSNDHDRKRPESIVLKLFKDGELFKTKEINAAENSLSANVWSYVFETVPKYNERGEPAVYDGKEFPVG